MSQATLDPERVTIHDKRAAFNPFDACPWIDFFEELTWGYMRREDRSWSPPGPHHERWFEDFASGRDLIRLAHRSSLKTTSTLAYVIANLEYRDGFHAAWIGNNQELAYEKAHSEFNKLIERNPWLEHLQEGRRTTDQKGKKEFENDSSIAAGWLHGGVEGRHVDLLVVDDLIKEKGDGDMADIENWLSSVIVPVQEHGGQTIVIGTRKTNADIYSLLAGREGFDFVEYPAVLEDWDAEWREDAPGRRPDPELYHRAEHPLEPAREAHLLWEQRSTDYLRGARSKQSEHAWMREFNLVVQTREGAVYSAFDRQQHIAEDAGDVVAYFNSLDWGSGHPAGFLQWAVTDDGRLHTVDERKFSVDGTQDYVDTLRTLHADWAAGPVACDPADKRGIDDLRSADIQALPADNDVDAGIRRVNDALADGELVVHPRCTELLEEIAQYRWNQQTGRPVKQNDHLVDAWRYGVMAYFDVLHAWAEQQSRRSADDNSSGVSYL